jgi:hypothetical protein
VNDRIEFFEEKEQSPFLWIESAFQPNDGDLVSILGKTWEVVGRSFSVDYADRTHRQMRCNVIVRAAAAIRNRDGGTQG